MEFAGYDAAIDTQRHKLPGRRGRYHLHCAMRRPIYASDGEK